MDVAAHLEQLHKRHMAYPKRRPDTAVSLASALWLWRELGDRKPGAVLELGSGFSSWVIHEWAGAGPALVVTTDDDDYWLAATGKELLLEGHLSGLLVSWDALQRTWPDDEPFDLIFHDLGKGASRHRQLGWLDAHLAPGGVIVLDDWQMEHVHGPCGEVLTELGYTVESLERYTLDKWDRFMAIAMKGDA